MAMGYNGDPSGQKHLVMTEIQATARCWKVREREREPLKLTVRSHGSDKARPWRDREQDGKTHRIAARKQSLNSQQGCLVHLVLLGCVGMKIFAGYYYACVLQRNAEVEKWLY